MARQRYVVTPKAAKTVTGNSGWLRLPPKCVGVRVTLDCNNGTGTTPTFDLTMNTNTVGSDTATRVAGGITAWAQITAAGGGIQRRRYSDLDDFVKFFWTIGGTTPSFTAGVTVEFITLADAA